MLRSFLIAFYRNSARHPLYAVLNVLGLSFGIAVFIIISLYVHFEATFDGWMPRAAHIYEVSTKHTGRPGADAPVYASAGIAKDLMIKVMPQLRVTRMTRTYSIFQLDEDPIEEEEYLADANLFDVLDLPLAAGRKDGALRPDTIVLSEAMARKYFGHTDVVGRRIGLRDLVGGVVNVPEGASDRRVYTVTAVVRDPPPNSSFHFRSIRLLTPERIAMYRNWDNWEGSIHRTFVAIDRPQQVAQMNAQFDRLIDSHGRSVFVDSQFAGTPRHDHLSLRLVPLSGEHLSDQKVVAAVFALGILGGLAFVIALVNYVNLATARTIIRAREAALRRTLGATTGELRLQFLGETVLLSLVSLILGFSFVELALPLINQLGGTPLRLHYLQGWPLLGWLSLAVLACGAAAGLYPAFIIAAYQPAKVFASTRSPSGGRLTLHLREVLVFVQFTLVSAFLIVVLGFTAQIRHLQTSDIGFDRHGLLMTNALINSSLDPGKVSAITAQWVALPNVVSITSGVTPGRYFSQSIFSMGRAGQAQPVVATAAVLVGDDYFTVFATPVLAGRPLVESDSYAGLTAGPLGQGVDQVNVVVNHSAVRAFGFVTAQAAVGQDIVVSRTTLHVVGVVGDQRLDWPSNPVRPTVYLCIDQMASTMPTIVKYENVSEDVIRARMISVWRRLAPDMPLDLTSGSEALDYYYDADRRMTRLFVMGACLVGLIGVIGLYGMAAFSTSARSVEIGLRKAMGGSRPRIAGRLVAQFLRPVILANLLAWPIAWWVLDRWFGHFDDRVPLSPVFFLTGSGVSLLIAVMTVSGLTWKAAGSSPGKTLRHE
ncbi:hypothetical protein ABAC460_19065 [Asticcacaulis sp. AC460]|uniref:ABC transporter permease n=1 Tax=Asticcacaulis sp. AC460 TaxID=1282360 RepID=UPI0003C3C433|nr:ABC transporter permease [Asticcacaulis sp. AC460]ESQ87429.1 hypothetical protein ABAC460_19065 [Asticcacaulis sp. AC460]